MRAPRPPRLAEALIGALFRREDREFALGDLAQEYAERHRRYGWILAPRACFRTSRRPRGDSSVEA